MSVTPHPTKGPGYWYIDIGYGKNRQRIPFDGTKEDALDYEKSLRRKRGLTTIHTDPRLREISEDYLRTYKLDHIEEGYDRQKRSVATIVDYFGAYNLSSISPVLIEQYKYKRLETVKPVTINKELCALSGIFKWARDENRIDVIPRIKKFPPKLTASPIADIPLRANIIELLPHIPEQIRGLFKLMFFYGLRSGEARKLRTENINLDAKTFWVKGKGGKLRSLPIMDDEIYKEFEQRCKNNTQGWLWYSPRSKGPYKDISESLKRAAKKAGIPSNIYPHLLRHGCATELVGLTDLRTAQAILGHSTIVTTEKYLHVREHRMSEALSNHSGNS
ncbi:MAG: tyrosine-type recombinase/integrase [Desulfuromonadaceae bacterium]